MLPWLMGSFFDTMEGQRLLFLESGSHIGDNLWNDGLICPGI